MTDDAFFAAGGRLRPIARFFFSTVLVLVTYLFSSIFLGLLAGSLHIPLDEYLGLLLFNLFLLLGILCIYKIFCALAEDKPLAFIGMAIRGRWVHELGLGIAFGSLMILAIGGLEWAFRVADFSIVELSASPPSHSAVWAAYLFIIFLVTGTTEELMFRGYPFQRLADSIGPAGATAVSAAFFGLVHLGNPGHSWISTFNTMLVGVTFAVAYLRTRSLWMPIAIHVTWNFVEGYVLGFPVSGIELPASLLRPQLHGPRILTGGAYGPEGSVLATGVIVAGTVYLLLSKRIYVSKEMRELVFGGQALGTAASNPTAPTDAGEGKFPQG